MGAQAAVPLDDPLVEPVEEPLVEPVEDPLVAPLDDPLAPDEPPPTPAPPAVQVPLAAVQTDSSSLAVPK